MLTMSNPIHTSSSAMAGSACMYVPPLAEAGMMSGSKLWKRISRFTKAAVAPWTRSRKAINSGSPKTERRRVMMASPARASVISPAESP
jgi:hypothetical protein